MELLSPDGYYTYLGLDKSQVVTAAPETAGLTQNVGEIDEDAVKKAYRKLSRKHHPDKGGDADTFKALSRAYRVLLNPKLREQYDILGIDLDDDTNNNDDGKPKEEDGAGDATSSTAQGIVQEIASMILTGIIQLAVRTGTCVSSDLLGGCFLFSVFDSRLPSCHVLLAMLGVISVFLIKYRLAFYPMLLFLGYLAIQIAGRASLRGGSVYETNGHPTEMKDMLSPLSIAVGLTLMHSGRNDSNDWTWVFWMGETTLIALFTLNSIEAIPRNTVAIGMLSVFAGLVALWFRGRFWNYAIVIAFEVFMALLVALAFPVMEIILEAVLNEKLKKVCILVNREWLVFQVNLFSLVSLVSNRSAKRFVRIIGKWKHIISIKAINKRPTRLAFNNGY